MAKVQLTGQQRVGPYTLLQHLGGAGGGQVWIARADNGDQVALKVLTKTNSGPLGRFKHEIAALEANKGVPGILPIIEEHVPAQSTEADLAWFSMPLATRIDHALDGKSPIVIGQAVLDVGRTMATLHAKNYTHRDIKPPNLVWWNNRACVIDFGLVSYEGKEDVTEQNSPLGPRWTMAPEMRRDPSVADGKPADVYSLAKTLWILLTGEQKGFDGQYVAASGRGRLSCSRRTGRTTR